ncbi:hypothetical protein EPA93_40050 [Ktedonosporobacter rubrisoli]|uniref:NfeD-like C-terminal domain-containing protein n=1 Tax=Ktedonosporobacter rubrisoli TaxID=2509675 RepID=A0A4P6K187_KTERU|nr:hypothetical protein [Ktedonosporobacter rubrisoli]QBD81839.1 hypothetical protein EPA93_40050 [Ktedonosporobacter rubrisoli]
MSIATDPLSLLFIACFLFGLIFLIASALLGSLGHGHAHDVGHSALHHVHTGGDMPTHHFPSVVSNAHTGHEVVHTTGEHHADGPGNSFSILAILNPTSIVLFLLGFGFFGYVFRNTVGLALPLAFLLAIISGIIIAALLLMLIDRVFGDSEGSTVQDISDRTGVLGKVSMTIQENNLGEIIYVSPGGMRKSIPARSLDGQRIEREQEVVVVNYQDGIAEVDTWEHFINQDAEEIGTANIPDAEELASLRALLEETDKPDKEYVMRKDLQKE